MASRLSVLYGIISWPTTNISQDINGKDEKDVTVYSWSADKVVTVPLDIRDRAVEILEGWLDFVKDIKTLSFRVIFLTKIDFYVLNDVKLLVEVLFLCCFIKEIIKIIDEG